MKKSKKISSYQKMKNKYESRISELISDIETLIGEDKYEASKIIVKWRHRRDIEKAMFFGGNKDLTKSEKYGEGVPETFRTGGVVEEIGGKITGNKLEKRGFKKEFNNLWVYEISADLTLSTSDLRIFELMTYNGRFVFVLESMKQLEVFFK